MSPQPGFVAGSNRAYMVSKNCVVKILVYEWWLRFLAIRFLHRHGARYALYVWFCEDCVKFRCVWQGKRLFHEAIN